VLRQAQNNSTPHFKELKAKEIGKASQAEKQVGTKGNSSKKPGKGRRGLAERMAAVGTPAK
jgi:hypothetical protein